VVCYTQTRTEARTIITKLLEFTLLVSLMIVLCTVKPAEAGCPCTSSMLTVDVEPSGAGTVEVGQIAPFSYPTTLEFPYDAPVRLKAVPTSGYHFDTWSGDLSGTTNPVVIVTDCDRKITANFSQVVHLLTIQVSGSGSTSPTTGTHSYSGETVVSITATPDSGWQFDGWNGDMANLGSASTTVTMDSDKTLTANFSQVKPSWLLIGGIVAGVIIVGMIVWLAVRGRLV